MIKEIRKKLFGLSDNKYKEFHYKLLNCNINLIGVRTPELKKIAKEISKEDYKEFFKEVTNEYYEEIMIEGFVIGYLKEDVKVVLNYVRNFVPKINNWAICDMFVSNLKIVKKKSKSNENNKELFYKLSLDFLKSKKEFEKRFAIVLFLTYYLDDEYVDKVFKQIEIVIKEVYDKKLYYVDMAIAWFLSVAYVKYQEKTIEFLNKGFLNEFTYNKTISKICDSYRISVEDKEKARGLKNIN